MTQVGRVRVLTCQTVNAPPDRVLAVLRDYREARPRILTDNYSDYRVEEGGEGDGTLISYRFAAGGRERDYRLRVSESGGRLHERDELSSFITTWRVDPSGAGSEVWIESSWEGAGGIRGVFERRFAPIGLRRIYDQMIHRLRAVVA
jgi:hypothetical protein